MALITVNLEVPNSIQAGTPVDTSNMDINKTIQCICGSEVIDIQISNDGGLSWVNIYRFSGNSNVTIEAFAGQMRANVISPDFRSAAQITITANTAMALISSSVVIPEIGPSSSIDTSNMSQTKTIYCHSSDQEVVIVEFSNDDGATWAEAKTIRANAYENISVYSNKIRARALVVDYRSIATLTVSSSTLSSGPSGNAGAGGLAAISGSVSMPDGSSVAGSIVSTSSGSQTTTDDFGFFETTASGIVEVTAIKDKFSVKISGVQTAPGQAARIQDVSNTPAGPTFPFQAQTYEMSFGNKIADAGNIFDTSPDGKYVLVMGDSNYAVLVKLDKSVPNIYIPYATSASEQIHIVAHIPFFTSDSEWVVYTLPGPMSRINGPLIKMRVDGSERVQLAESGMLSYVTTQESFEYYPARAYSANHRYLLNLSNYQVANTDFPKCDLNLIDTLTETTYSVATEIDAHFAFMDQSGTTISYFIPDTNNEDSGSIFVVSVSSVLASSPDIVTVNTGVNFAGSFGGCPFFNQTGTALRWIDGNTSTEWYAAFPAWAPVDTTDYAQAGQFSPDGDWWHRIVAYGPPGTLELIQFSTGYQVTVATDIPNRNGVTNVTASGVFYCQDTNSHLWFAPFVNPVVPNDLGDTGQTNGIVSSSLAADNSWAVVAVFDNSAYKVYSTNAPFTSSALITTVTTGTGVPGFFRSADSLSFYWARPQAFDDPGPAGLGIYQLHKNAGSATIIYSNDKTATISGISPSAGNQLISIVIKGGGCLAVLKEDGNTLILANNSGGLAWLTDTSGYLTSTGRVFPQTSLNGIYYFTDLTEDDLPSM